jgi:hypothetical protein
MARALLVGINYYPGIGNLQGPENDVAALEAWLSSPAGGGLNPDTEIRKITSTLSLPNGQPPSPAKARPVMYQIYEWVDELVEEGKAAAGEFPLGDRLYMFFAGHGFHSAGRTALFMANAWANNLGEAIPMQPLAEYVRSYAFFREVILVADTCREQIDFAPDPYFARKPEVSPNAGKVRRFDAYPCAPGLKTRELPFDGVKGGVLTHAFLTGVQGFAARGGQVRSDFLKGYMINAVSQKLEQTPEINCSEEAEAFPICQAQERTTRLTVKPAQGAPAGAVTVVDGYTGATVAAEEITVSPIQVDVRPGFYQLKRQSGEERTIRVAWESTDVEF